MKKIFSFIIKFIAVVIGLVLVAFGAVQTVYWLNLDNKFMFALYLICRKVSSKIKRDRKF